MWFWLNWSKFGFRSAGTGSYPAFFRLPSAVSLTMHHALTVPREHLSSDPGTPDALLGPLPTIHGHGSQAPLKQLRPALDTLAGGRCGV